MPFENCIDRMKGLSRLQIALLKINWESVLDIFSFAILDSINWCSQLIGGKNLIQTYFTMPC